MSKKPAGLGMEQVNKKKRLLLRVIGVFIFVGVGLFVAKLLDDSQCTSWLTSTEGTKVACIGTVGEAKTATDQARPALK